MKKLIRRRVFVGIQLPSKAIIYVNMYCSAMVGRLSYNKQIKKLAGYSYLYGRRPKVRGVAMNPVDHPHGGGEGKKSKPSCPKNPWGTSNKWKKTVSRFVLARRLSFIKMMKKKAKNWNLKQ